MRVGRWVGRAREAVVYSLRAKRKMVLGSLLRPARNNLYLCSVPDIKACVNDLQLCEVQSSPKGARAEAYGTTAAAENGAWVPASPSTNYIRVSAVYVNK